MYVQTHENPCAAILVVSKLSPRHTPRNSVEYSDRQIATAALFSAEQRKISGAHYTPIKGDNPSFLTF
jgi:hypothetical protein